LTEEVSIGRDSSAEICIDRSDVSRQHARLFRRDGLWNVSDLGSTNGTELNGARIAGDERLRNGDLIKTGGVIFKYLDGSNIEVLFHEEIHRLAICDGLTGAYNKRYLLDFLDREVARAQRYGSPLWLAMFDIDHFKNVNDEYGHPSGDRVLTVIGEVAGAMMRREQLLARYGGEEFAVVLPEMTEDQVRQLCERLRKVVARQVFDFAGREASVTISIGAACLGATMTRDELIAAADEALYKAKRDGRDRVVIG
jgi:diguanylate cyclase (GGDEF)-like protein